MQDLKRGITQFHTYIYMYLIKWMWQHWPNAAVLEKQNTGNYFFFAINENYYSSKAVSIKMLNSQLELVFHELWTLKLNGLNTFKPFLIIQVAASLQSGLKKIRSRHSFLHVKKLKFMTHKNLCQCWADYNFIQC